MHCVYNYIVGCSVHIGFFFFQAEDGIRDLVRSRGLGDVYKRQVPDQAKSIARSDINADSNTSRRTMSPRVAPSE